MVRYIIIILSLFFSQKIYSSEIFGYPKVVDGDTIYIKNYKIRLEGIDAPEMQQTCRKPFLQIAFFNFQKDYYCGKISKQKLSKKIGKQKIKCILNGKDRYKRFLAKCFKGKTNINRWMVRRGYAVAYKKYSKQYILDENLAKEEKLGLWEGSFLSPEKWRKLN